MRRTDSGSYDVSNPYVGRWATEYDKQRFGTNGGRVFDGLERRELRRILAGLRGRLRVLEVGCGTGRFFNELFERGFDVTGLDPSPDMLRITRAKYTGRTDLRLVHGAGECLPFEVGAFDFVYAIRLLNQLGDKSSAVQCLQEMLRVTRPGGSVLIEFANVWRPGTMRRANASVRLSFTKLKREIMRFADVQVVRESGILILSQTALHRVPGFALPFWVVLDKWLSGLFPNLCARGYMVIRVPPAERMSGHP